MNQRTIHVLLILFILLTLSSAVIAGDNNKAAKRQPRDPDCLEVCAKAMVDGHSLSGLTIKLYCGNKEIVRIDSTEFEKVFFALKRGRYYTVEISKQGYVPRLIGISTALPKSVPLKPIFHFEFEVEMLAEQDNTDSFYLDFPVALVSYNPKSECFEHNKKYTSRIKREIAKERPVDTAANEALHSAAGKNEQ